LEPLTTAEEQNAIPAFKYPRRLIEVEGLLSLIDQPADLVKSQPRSFSYDSSSSYSSVEEIIEPDQNSKGLGFSGIVNSFLPSFTKSQNMWDFDCNFNSKVTGKQKRRMKKVLSIPWLFHRFGPNAMTHVT
jgi:hypothetical protein